VRGWTASPRELFTGRKAVAKRDFRCAFGDYVQCTVPNTTNSLKERTEDAVVMHPTGNRTGSVRMLALRTGKIITRDHFRVLRMPLSVIETLNRMAAADGITTTRTHTGVSTNSIRDFEHAPSRLPTMITPSSLTDEDPNMALRDGTAAGFELQLADDTGMDQYNGTVERSEAGGVPSANFQAPTFKTTSPTFTTRPRTLLTLANSEDTFLVTMGVLAKIQGIPGVPEETVGVI
jgi:hypothetical protein